VHCTKISSEFECQGQMSRSPGTKTKKCGILFGSRPLGAVLIRHFFSGAVLGCAVLRQFYAGEIISACCVVLIFDFNFISLLVALKIRVFRFHQ